MRENLEKVKLLACDLRNGKEFPRSPRETVGGYVLAARAVDKCRAVLVGWQGEYHSNCPLDHRWLKFAEIDHHAYRSFVATGATNAVHVVGGRRTAPCADYVSHNEDISETPADAHLKARYGTVGFKE
jgi:hypothetical protein